jgi:drug/metabolite transporter (DMT)-like permease
MVRVAAPARARTGRSATVAAFCGAVALGGTNFVAVRFSNRELEPLWGAGARFAIAALLFATASVVLRLTRLRVAEVGLVVAYGLLAFGATYGLLYWGMREVTAGAAAVIFGAGPLLTLFLASAHRLEQVHARALVGALTALVGTVVMFLPSGRADVGVLPIAAVGLAAVTASESVVIARRCRSIHPVSMNAIGMGVGAAAILAVSALGGESWAPPREPATILAFGYLTASSVVLFVLVLLVVRRWTASASAYIFVLMPPVALVVGALLGGEPITAAGVLGALVVIAGVYAGALRPRHRAR